MTTTDVSAADVTWNLDPLLQDRTVDDLLDEADRRAGQLAQQRGTVGDFDLDSLRTFMAELEAIHELVGRAESYAHLTFVGDTGDPARGALLQKVNERTTAIGTQLIFFDLEWAKVPDERAGELLAGDGMDRYGHHLRSVRRYRDHLLSESEERIVAEKSVTGRGAWVRLFEELASAVRFEFDGREVGLEEGLSALQDPDRAVRQRAAAAVTAGLQPGLRTRAYVYNTLMADKATDDRLRNYSHWLASWNLAQQASDESVEALVSAVRNRYDIPQRWYKLQAHLLGVERLADYDRIAPVADDDDHFPFDAARELVLDCYTTFSPELGDIVRGFFDGSYVDAPVRPGKSPGAFCAYTVPSAHPYVLLNYTGRRRDVMTLAHELGHGVHGTLARPQGVFHQSTPLTLAETASVFGETVVLGRLLSEAPSAAARLSLLAESVDGAVATVFRQTAMNRFENLAHNARRTEGELSTDRLGELWVESQEEMFGDSVEISEGYRSWWSYIPHFIGTPGYVYAYAYGQLLALSVYRRYQERGPSFVPRYLQLLSAGGSDTPEALAHIVDCDLGDPAFWDGGLDIIAAQVEAAESAAREAGRMS